MNAMQDSDPHSAPSHGFALPTGTVTFLFTDIEGSTQRWDANRAAMQEAVRRHDALVRTAIESHAGLVFKTIGDAFCAAFTNAPDAVAAALDAQRAVNAVDWSAVDGLRVRIALHTGSTDERDGDYFGPAVNRVARLLAIAHGGQVLVSGITADLVQGEMPPQSSLRDLGAHRLKDLTHPEQIYQLIAAELQGDFPPLRSLDALPNNLPLQVTAFVGRDEAIAEITALLEKARIVTLVGTGGVGKTRTALQVAADLLDANPDGVWFVELAPLVDASLVAGAVSSALGVPPATDRPALDVLIGFLKERRLLLVLDNCEHVVVEAAHIADAVVRGCPQVKVFATSREGLNVAGERVFRMPSLRVPPAGEKLRAVDAAAYESVALFVDRASAADGRFALSDENALTVADICRRLDGIALAIELAAPRVKVLAVHQLSQRLDERFRLLTGGARTALPRQQTMRALIDWSFDLLSENEKLLFRDLAVFAGGWTIEAATEICADEVLESWDILDLLSALVDKSLVATELSGTHQRYRLLESMRQYARERLTASSDAAAVARRHAAYFCRIAEEAYPSSGFMAEREWLAPLAPEIDNFRAALTWSVAERNDVEAGAAAIGVLFRLFERLSLVDEGIRWCEAGLAEAAQLQSSTVARLYFAYGFLLGNNNQNRRAIVATTRSIELYRETADEAALCAALESLARALAVELRYDEAREVVGEAVALARKVGDAQLTARALQYSGIAFEPAQIEQARECFREAAGIFRTLGRTSELGNALIWWADVEAGARNFESAIELSRESLEFALPYDRMCCFSNIACYALSMNDSEQALPAAREALALSIKDQRPLLTAFSMMALALVEARDGDRERAARLLGYVNARMVKLDMQFGRTEQTAYDALVTLLNGHFEENELARLTNEGTGWTEQQAAAEAQLVCEQREPRGSGLDRHLQPYR